jgi:hypothetical protein
MISGGHGTFTNHFGLGSDNALEFEVVTPTGQTVIANEASNSDLFWALRGGGPGLGVITKITMKAHDSTPLNAVRLRITPQIDVETSEGQEAWAKTMAYMVSRLGDFAEWGLTGHPIMLNYQFETLLTAPGKGQDEISAFIQPFITELQDTYGAKVTNTPIASSALALMMSLGLTPNAMIPNNPGEGPAIMASRLLSKEGLQNVPKLEAMLAYLFANNYTCEPFNIGGRAVSDTSIDSAINPAWRETLMHFTIMPMHQSEIDTIGEVVEKYEGLAEGLSMLDELSVNSGAYLNEVSTRSIESC